MHKLPSSTSSTRGLSIIELDEGNYEIWFDLDDSDQSITDRRARIAEQVNAFKPAYLRKLIVKEKNKVIGRMNVLQSSLSRFTLWKPVIHPDSDVSRPIMKILLDYLISAERVHKCTSMEAKICRSEAGTEEWESALQAAGFLLISDSVILEWIAETEVTPTKNSSEIQPGSNFTVEELFSLYLACLTDSFDRESCGTAKQLMENFQGLMEESERERWRILVLKNRPVAMCVIGRDEADPCEPIWIPFIGVMRERRRMGIGRALLSTTLAQMDNTNLRRFRSFVDVENTPSLALHRSVGFNEYPERYATYRRVKDDRQ